MNSGRPGEGAISSYNPPAMTSAFDQYIGVDYSGAGDNEQGLAGLRVYVAADAGPPREVRPRRDRRRHWSRRTLAEWLSDQLNQSTRSLVGVDHGFGFPLSYLERYRLIHRPWRKTIDDFRDAWPTDEPGVRVEDVRRGRVGRGGARAGDARERRLVERRTGGAKSIFHFDVPGSVAKSTHAGLPWLARIVDAAACRVHVWPFDGWTPAPGLSVLSEVFPSRWRALRPTGRRTADQHDAFVIAAALRDAAQSGALADWWTPRLSAADRATASAEGWILGVTEG